MDNIINETNTRIQEIIDNLSTIKEEYKKKLESKSKVIEEELEKVDKYKKEFFTSKEKIEKMNSDIEGFEEDYKKLVERFKDDELANILIAANKEISSKIEERKRKIAKDTVAMNELVEKAEDIKKKLVKLTAEKKALQLCLDRISDSYEYYSEALGKVITYANENVDKLNKHVSEEPQKDTLSLDDEKIFSDDLAALEKELESVDESIKNEVIEDERDGESDIDHSVEDKQLDLKDEESIEKKENKQTDKQEESTSQEEIEEDKEYVDIDDDIFDKDDVENIDFNIDIDFDDNFDLESVLNIDDSIQDDDSLYKEKEDK